MSEQGTPKHVAHVEIIAFENGSIQLALPDDTILAYGLLHLALDEVQKRHTKLVQDQSFKAAIESAPLSNGSHGGLYLA